MNRTTQLLGATLLLACTAFAQDNSYTRMETFLGYDFLRFNSARNIPAFSANGGGGQFAYNFNSWIGGVADIYAVHYNAKLLTLTDPTTGIVFPRSSIDATARFYQFGPRVSIRQWSRVTPFFQFLAGVVSGSASVPVYIPPGTTITTPVQGGLITIGPTGTPTHNVFLRANAAGTNFAYLLGGGLDLKMTKHCSIRPIGLDLQFTRISQLTAPQTTRSQYNLRYSAGVNFTFGSAQ